MRERRDRVELEIQTFAPHGSVINTVHGVEPG
jgi:hypothetical protein